MKKWFTGLATWKQMLISFIVLFSIYRITSSSDAGPQEKREPIKDAATLQQEKIEKLFSPWDGSLRSLEKLVKSSMNDPDSYEHDKTMYWVKDGHLIVATSFRGKNKFGGVVRNAVKAKVDFDGNVIEILEQE
jgi:uncharacterized alpha/beta hydrolase family protein